MITNLALEEIIRNYDRENDRRQSLESKASYLVGILSILVGLMTAILTSSSFSFSDLVISFFLVILSFLLFILSGFFLLRVLVVRSWCYPVKSNDPDELYAELNDTDNELINDLFDSYLGCYCTNNLKNNEKARFLSYALIFLVLGIFTFVIAFFSFLGGW